MPLLEEDYAGSWSSCRLSARVDRTIRLLEQNQTEMEEKGVSRERLGIVLRSMKQMKGRLDLLNRVKEKMGKGIRKVKQVFLRA